MSEITESNSISRLGRAPIVVGVTGHRDIPDADNAVLESATRSVLTKIAGLTPNSPHVLISSLAEGADRMAARIAIQLGWDLGIVLPAPEEIYERDFPDSNSRDQFGDLLKLAAWIERLPADQAGVPDYLGAGIRLMQQSQLLLAYWDGKDIGLPGGTGDIVKRFLFDIPDSGFGLSGNTPPDARPVIHIKTRRKKYPDLSSESLLGNTEWLAPNPGGMGSDGELTRWTEVLRRIDIFNADVKRIIETDLSKVESSRKYLDGEPLSVHRHTYPLNNAASSMFSVADALSTCAQVERNAVFIKLAGLATLAIIFQQIYSGPFSSPFILGAALVSGIIAVLVFKLASLSRVEDRYLDYRVLAEACRVQHFWLKTGVKASVADNFLLEQRDELEWIRQAVRTNDLSIDLNSMSAPADVSNIEATRKHWVEDQRKYFIGTAFKLGKSELNRLKMIRWSSIASTLFFSGVVAVFTLAVAQILLMEHYLELGAVLVQYSGIAYGLLFAASGMIKVYQEINAFSEHSKSYRRSGMLMNRASQRLVDAESRNDVILSQRILYETGCEALDENGDWLLLHRNRPVEVPLV